MVRLGNHWGTTMCHRLQARQEVAERPPLVPDLPPRDSRAGATATVSTAEMDQAPATMTAAFRQRRLPSAASRLTTR